MKLEKIYQAKFLLESCIKNQDGTWMNRLAFIFFTEVPHPKGSNYLAILPYHDTFYLADGESACEPFLALEHEGLVYHSRFRHDYREIPGGAVDGGRDYLRVLGAACTYPRVYVSITQDTLSFS